MAKIVFWSFPGHGHINPSLPVIAELVKRGEQIIYYATDEFRPAIEQTGATFRSYGNEFPFFQRPRGAHSPVQIIHALLLTSKWALDTLLPEAQALHPDLMIYDALCPWGRFIAEKMQVPTVSSHTSMAATKRMVFSALFSSPLAILDFVRMWFKGRADFQRNQALMNKISQIYQVKKVSPFTLFSNQGMLNIVYTSRAFQPQADAFDQQHYAFVGTSLHPRSEAPTFPFETLEQGKPLVYVSLGTAFNNQPEFFRSCMQALEHSDWQVVMAVGQAAEQQIRSSAPQNVHVQAFVPQLEVLQRASVFITHGGMNSVNEALYYGVPLVVVPQAADQPLVARRVAELGAGRQLSPKHLSADRLRRITEEVLTQPTYKHIAEQLGATLRAAGGYQKAADEIQTFLHKQAYSTQESVVHNVHS